jgi:hypothetical protein
MGGMYLTLDKRAKTRFPHAQDARLGEIAQLLIGMLLGHTKSTTTGMYGIVPQGIFGERVKMIDTVDFEL